jgi:mRNA-degrading endonuclease RelE of RelBE toxin-antitoxin system
MSYEVRIRSSIIKNLTKLPISVQKLFFMLVEDLKADGPIQKSWPSFSTLGKNQYHCHLNYSYVSCWTWVKGSIEIEVYYVGSREKAPY